MDKAYLFVGGPWDQRRVKTGGRLTLRVPVQPALIDMLQASLEIVEKGMAAVPPMRIAEYRLDRQVYRFIGWESHKCES